MGNLIEEAYKKLAEADKELSVADREYNTLQNELLHMQSEKKIADTTMSSLQHDIDMIDKRLINHTIEVSNECSDLESKYNKVSLGNHLPNTLKEIMNLTGEEKVEAEQELNRIVNEYSEEKFSAMEVYTELANRIQECDQKIFEAQLMYGQLPEKEEEIYALNEKDPKDRQTIKVIMDLLPKDPSTDKTESQLTWEDAKRKFQSIQDNYTAIRDIQKANDVQRDNLLKADLDILRTQMSTPFSFNEASEIITKESIALIDGEIKRNAGGLGISSLDEYFKAEQELHRSKPDTKAIDDLPIVAHFFTKFNELSPEEANKARQTTNELIEKYRETHSSNEVIANSIEDYENSVRMESVWADRKHQIFADLSNKRAISEDLVKDLANGELKSKILAYNQIEKERKELELEYKKATFDQFPVHVTDVKKMKEEKPEDFVIFSERVRSLAGNDFGEKYNADILIQEHTEMRRLEYLSKVKPLDKKDGDELERLVNRVYLMKHRLEQDKKKYTTFLGKPKFSDDDIAAQYRLKNELEEKTSEFKTLGEDITNLTYEEITKSAAEAASKKAFIKRTIVEPAQKEAFEQKKSYEKKELEHHKLTEKVKDVLSNFKDEQIKKQEKNYKALQKDEAMAIEENKASYVKSDSAKAIVEAIKAENAVRKSNSLGQKLLDKAVSGNKQIMSQLNKELGEVMRNTEAWVKADKEARIKNIQLVNKGVTEDLDNQIKTARKEARSAGIDAKVMGFVSQKVGSFTDIYRKKIKELSDGMIKAPRMEKEAEHANLTKKLEEARKSLAAMERNELAYNKSGVSRSAIEEAEMNQRMNKATDDISEITSQIAKVNLEIQKLKSIEEKRLQDNAIKFNSKFGDVILTDREQLLNASETKRNCEIAAANGDQKQIDRANADYELRKQELNDKFGQEDLEDQKLMAEIQEINQKSDEWGHVFDDNTKSKIDSFVTIGEKIFNFAAAKAGMITASEGLDPLNVKASLDEIKEGLTSNPSNEHVVDKVLEIGELVYQKLQTANESLEEKYQKASREHAFKHNFYEAMDIENKRFQEICKEDVENKMGVSLKDKRITYLNQSKAEVNEKLTQDRQHKEISKSTMEKQVNELTEYLIPNKEQEISKTTDVITNKMAVISKLEEALDLERDNKLNSYRENLMIEKNMTDKQISKSASDILIDRNKPISNAELIGQLTNSTLDTNASMEDVMEQINKINMNGLGLINFIDPEDQYFHMLSANEAEKQAFKEKLLESAGSTLKDQFGHSIISVEQDDMLLHPVLIEDKPEFNNSVKSMVADFNAVRLDAARLNVAMRKERENAKGKGKEPQMSERDKQLQQVYDKAVKQSRSRVSLSSLMNEEKTTKSRTWFSRLERTNERTKEDKQKDKGGKSL